MLVISSQHPIPAPSRISFPARLPFSCSAQFDELTEAAGLMKVETVGAVYVAVAGLPTFRADHSAALATLALQMMDKLEEYRDGSGRPLTALMGIHCGPVIGGIIGAQMPR